MTQMRDCDNVGRYAKPYGGVPARAETGTRARTPVQEQAPRPVLQMTRPVPPRAA